MRNRNNEFLIWALIVVLIIILVISLRYRPMNNISTTSEKNRIKRFVGSETLAVKDYDETGSKFNIPSGANYAEFQPQGVDVRIRLSNINDGGIIVYKDSIGSFDTYNELLNAKISSVEGAGSVYVNYFFVS